MDLVNSSAVENIPGRRLGWLHWARWCLGLLLAALSLWWLLTRDLNWQAVLVALSGADYGWVLLGFLSTVGTVLARAQRWRLLLWQADVGLRAALTGLMIGQVGNMLLPRGGDLARVAWIAPENRTETPEAVGALVVEKFFDLLALFICGLLLLLWGSSLDWLFRWMAQLGIVLVIGTVGLLLVLYWRPVFVEELLERIVVPFGGWGQWALRLLQRIEQGLASVRKPAVMAHVALWTVLYWVLGIATNRFVMQAFDVSENFGVSLLSMAIMLMVALMAGAAVSVPVGLGVFEGITVALLTSSGVSPDVALAVGVVLHLIVVGPPVVLALALSLVWGRNLYKRMANGRT